MSASAQFRGKAEAVKVNGVLKIWSVLVKEAEPTDGADDGGARTKLSR